MNHSRTVFGAARVAIAITMMAWLGACAPDAATALVGRKVPVVGSATAPATGAAPVTSVPDAAASFAAQDAAELAKAATPSTVTAEQESKAMPMAGQANDHSTPARDKQPGT